MFVPYPPIKPYATHQLAVDAIHTLYIEESGNPLGLPVIFLHGGPGAGCDEMHRRFFDPLIYRIVLFDQRGAGKSTPHAELEKNTTEFLVSDMENIRRHLQIERWVVFGGSWGSTLGLVYAETHPERVLNLILRGIFLCRPQDLSWFYEEGGASRIFPDGWREFITHLPEAERSTPLESYYKRLLGPDELSRMSAAKAWSRWEAECATLQPNSKVVDHLTEPHVALSLSRIEAHYFMNHAFLAPDQIIKNAYRLANIPGVIVHGRYDIVCPMDNAYALLQAWPNARLEIIPDAGHSASEAGILSALVGATNAVARQYMI